MQHFLDLCAVLGQPAPAEIAEIDPTGDFYTFEKGVEKSGGGRGFADVWYKGRFAIEYKGKHKDLNAAYQQLLQYHEPLKNPPLLVVTDTERFEIHTKFDRTVSRVYRFTNAELPEPENLRVLRAMFEDPDSLRPARTVESVTEEAARKFARLADGMRARGVEPHEAAHFLNKLLFCFFAEDIGLLPKGLFTRVVERARKDIESGKAKRVGLLATNYIRGGKNRRVLQRIKQSGDIFFAESDRPWILNGAAVRVSMVGFDNGEERDRNLNGALVEAIYSDLTGALDLAAAQVLSENKGIAFIGGMKKGSFDITEATAHEMMKLPANPNGRPNSDVIRPWINGLDITRRPRGMQIIDFGVEMPEDEASLYEVPFEYVCRHVKPEREKVRNRLERTRWWLHARPAPDLRVAVRGLNRYIATARVAKHRLFVFADAKTLPDGQVVTFALSDDYSFGVLHSRAHELWALRMGTSLEDRPRYTPTTCFETFPFPEPDEEQRAEISAAAKRLDELRRNWLNPEGASEAELKKRTLTNLYNARPTWLANAHARLDAAVYAAYGWSADLTGGLEEPACAHPGAVCRRG